MKCKIVVVNGVTGHGKDSFVEFCQEYFDGYALNHSTIDRVKRAGLILGADETKNKGERERRLWSDIKKAWMRYNDGPFQELLNVVESAKVVFNDKDIVVFVHVREPKEIERIKNYFGDKCLSLIVVNNRIKSVPNNSSDENVFDCQYDFFVCNDGEKNDLKAMAKFFVYDVLNRD